MGNLKKEEDDPPELLQFKEGVEFGHRPQGPDLKQPRCTSLRSSPLRRTVTVRIQPSVGSRQETKISNNIILATTKNLKAVEDEHCHTECDPLT